MHSFLPFCAILLLLSILPRCFTSTHEQSVERLQIDCNRQLKSFTDYMRDTLKQIPFESVKSIVEIFEDNSQEKNKCNEQIMQSLLQQFDQMSFSIKNFQRKQRLDNGAKHFSSNEKASILAMLHNYKQSIVNKCQVVTEIVERLRSDWTRNVLLELAEATQYDEHAYSGYSHRLIESAQKCIDYLDNVCRQQSSDHIHILDRINNTIRSIANRWFDDYYRIIADGIAQILATNHDFKRTILNDMHRMLTIDYPNRLWSIGYFPTYHHRNDDRQLADEKITDYFAYYPSNQSSIGPNRAHVIIVRYRHEIVALLGSDNTTGANDRACQQKARQRIGQIPTHVIGQLNEHNTFASLFDYIKFNDENAKYPHIFATIFIKHHHRLLLKISDRHQLRFIDSDANGSRRRQYLLTAMC